jgi:hypothetical protein
MNPIRIEYHFGLGNGKEEVFPIVIDPITVEVLNNHNAELPSWTELEFHKCSHCSLTSDFYTHCPVAVSLVDVIGKFDNVVSHNKITLTVITAERKFTQETTAQKGISSMVGLLLAASGCPHTAYFKPMARFHLPLASEVETFYRATGMYLLAQYLLNVNSRSANFDLEGLKNIYHNLHILNTMIAERIRSATLSDSSVNAIILLDMFTNLMPFILDEQLDEIRHLFIPYLQKN